MRAVFVTTLSAFFASSAHAGPVDCDQLKKTRIPFQITFVSSVPGESIAENDIEAQKRSESIGQVYRNDGGFSIQYGSNSSATKPSKIISKYGFLQTSTQFFSGKNRSTEVTYTPTPSVDLKAQRRDFSLKLSTKLTVDGNTSSAENQSDYKFVGEEPFVLGPCIFTGLKYEVQITMLRDGVKKPLPTAIYIYSSDLGVTLFHSLAYKVGDEPEHRTNLVAKSILTDFQPLPQ